MRAPRVPVPHDFGHNWERYALAEAVLPAEQDGPPPVQRRQRMLYVRISLMTAKPDCERQVTGIQDDLLAYYASQRGYVRGYKLRSTSQARQLGRVTVWRSAEDADAAAQSPHVLAQRSKLQSLIEDEFDGSYDAPEEPES